MAETVGLGPFSVERILGSSIAASQVLCDLFLRRPCAGAGSVDHTPGQWEIHILIAPGEQTLAVYGTIGGDLMPH